MQYASALDRRFHERYAEFKRQCGPKVELAIADTVPQIPLLSEQ